ncbi:hypothetical protein N9998_00115 [Nitrosopumilus sp.]|nr:hypothetical protein [Nitrosopumilus sp.]|tara:strand:+ start:1322 stop:1507 length:186 start_codon:yes stop_codon:yes gene_type:complete
MTGDNLGGLIGLGVGLGVIGMSMNMLFGATAKEGGEKKVKFCKACNKWVPLTHKHGLKVKK